ncbi:Nitrate transport protein NrtA precursor [compost metagenome]
MQNEPDRAGFDAMPWYSMATWMLTQMKRWGYVKGEMNFNALAEQVFLMTDARRQMASLAMSEANAEPASGYKSFSVMGRPFDPRQPQAYLDGFAIKRS